MKKVIIIDDDAWMRESVARYLTTHADLQCIEASNCIDALDILNEQQHVPDCILLDIFLPGYNAFTFINELRSHHDFASIPIILWTSHVEGIKDVSLGAYGIVSVINKTTMTNTTVYQAICEAIHNESN